MRERFSAAAGLIAAHRDVLDARPGDSNAFAVLHDRGWASFLLAMDEQRLVEAEILGVSARWSDAPASLAAMVSEVRRTCDLPAFASTHSGRAPRRLESPAKRAQVDAFAAAILPLARRARRVLDVGSGHGHLTREIAERIELEVIGLERNAALADRARSLSCTASLSFDVTDVLHDGLPLGREDCVVGLHACGELGDAMVERAAESGARVALCGCCLQKRRGPMRLALSSSDGALALPKRLLGLSNLTARDEGVENSRAENVAARERRLALHELLSKEGPALRFGEEIAGLNRRRAHDDLPELVRRAFEQRGRAVPSAAAIAEAAAWARVEHGRMRRLGLARAMLARPVEVFVLLDRALYLEERGFAVTIGTLFPASVSARNLALVGEAC